MSNTDFVPVWTQIVQLLEQKVSVIPIWDKDREWNGEQVVKKRACFKWQEYQKKIISKEELWAQMDKAETTAVAMICGAVSGNLEVIDIDVKNKNGIDAELFQSIQTLYPDLFSRLRIHRTPSGGFHILYRCIQPVPGNSKLACREKTDEELRLFPKPKTLCYIETRGEGGYVAAPPSLGYSVHIDNPIPVLSWEERCSLISLCTAFNQLVKSEQTYVPTKAESSYYDESPFEHYNRVVDPVELMKEGGWHFVKRSGNYLWFSRPGASNRNDVHGSFNIEKRFFFIFSTSTSLESDRAYLPSTIYAHFKHGSDKRSAASSLISLGFGRIKPSVESKLVKASVIRSKPLPPNASQEAQTSYIEQKANLEENHPHGLFWSGIDDKIEIERERFYAVAEALGFRCWQLDVVQIVDYKVYRRTEREFYDSMKQYIHEEDFELYMKICNAFEAFIQKNGQFSMTRLEFLDQSLLLTDTANTCFKFFSNCYIEITKNDIEIHSYSFIQDRLVWAEKIQSREYNQDASTDCAYTEFLSKAIANDEEHIQSCVGYLAHEYKDETIGYIIALTEECADPKEGGGAGKNIFCNLLSYTTTFKSIPGTLVKYDEKFLQAWDYERVLALSDVPKKFDFSFLKEMTTGAGKVKKLFRNELSIPVELMPKFIVSTQFSYEVTDGGLRRRIIPIEFTDFFTKIGGVDIYFRKHFPKGWTKKDWEGYDFYIVGCIQTWLKQNLKLSQPSLSDTGKQKQLEHTYGKNIIDFFAENIEYWTSEGRIEIGKFREALHAFYDDNDISKQFQISTIKLNQALAEFCQARGVEYDPNYQWSQGGIKFKGKLFLRPAPF